MLLTLLLDKISDKLVVGQGVPQKFDSLIDILRKHSRENFGNCESGIDNTLNIVVIVLLTFVIFSVHKFQNFSVEIGAQ
jgi:hypothetical protein